MRSRRMFSQAIVLSPLAHIEDLELSPEGRTSLGIPMKDWLTGWLVGWLAGWLVALYYNESTFRVKLKKKAAAYGPLGKRVPPSSSLSTIYCETSCNPVRNLRRPAAVDRAREVSTPQNPTIFKNLASSRRGVVENS
ncbi:hypothetical protein HZH68_014292 [Vespula germanica]|uniref:Uncharacterized protein n=1 Tax=Vespula germanica TaxID=30212 RepID=A0A834MU83_VESGE|nr:hypothetical protein HZH68_014292 [Vespula germanica]